MNFFFFKFSFIEMLKPFRFIFFSNFISKRLFTFQIFIFFISYQNVTSVSIHCFFYFFIGTFVIILIFEYFFYQNFLNYVGMVRFWRFLDGISKVKLQNLMFFFLMNVANVRSYFFL
jgi:hypothetical protein